MLFNSITFVLYFIIVTAAYFALPYNKRWILLLAASCYFYMAFVPIYILILGFTIIVDYFAGIYIENATGKRRRLFLIISLIANISVLCVFKYYNFLNNNFSYLLKGFALENPIPYLSILLPIGLSFHTFQAMSYTIEVYRGNQKAERHFGIYSLYVMFYPQLVAGPIERPQNLLHQFREKYDFDADRIMDGLKLMLWGLFKKIVIADRLALYVNSIYNHPDQHNGMSLILASVFFSFQIYCDFSGYSDIAIGAARVMGFKLMTNFKRPHYSRNIAEFWKRWHISLSTWFRDYFYFSMGGKRVSVPRWYLNLFLVFLLSGLWHGANWTFVLWGALNGIYYVVETMTNGARSKFVRFIRLDKLPKLLLLSQILVTFTLLCFARIFFRANNIDDAFIIIKKVCMPEGPVYIGSPVIMLFSLIGILFLVCVEFKREYFPNLITLTNHKSWIVRNLYFSLLIILILLIGVFDGGQFIYFQF